jgi:iron(III) transport system substrate-binding protein
VFATTLVGLIYNSDLVKGDDIPKRLSDVLKPKWKGKIASTPYAAGMREFAMPDVLGREAVFDFTRKLSKQISGLMRCGEMDRITSGEFLMLVLACGESNVNMARRRGMPLGYALLRDAIVAHTRYAGVPKNSAAPNAAALIIAYLHTPEGQKLLWDLDGLDLHLYPESNQKKKVDKARASGAKVLVSSPQWLGSHKHYRQTQKELQKILRRGDREGEEEKVGSGVGLISSAWKGPGTFHAALFHP